MCLGIWKPLTTFNMALREDRGLALRYRQLIEDKGAQKGQNIMAGEGGVQAD